MASGKSISNTEPKGKRRVVSGKELAPRSLRRKGKQLLSDGTQEDLEKLKL